MDVRVFAVVVLVSALLPAAQQATSNKSRKIQYEYFDDYLLSLTSQDAKAMSHNRVPKPDTDQVTSDLGPRPALDSTSDDEDLVEASGDGGVKGEGKVKVSPVPSRPGRRHRPNQHPVVKASEEDTREMEDKKPERKQHHHLYTPESLPEEEKEKLREEDQEEEDEEDIRAEAEARDKGEEVEEDDTDPTWGLDILGYFKDVPREHWSCCMLGKLAGDKGFHCHAGFYAARITTRNPNRAHNQKMLWHGPDRMPTWGWDIMRTFQRCVARHAAEFHKCCFAATIEKRERSKWERYRRERHLVQEQEEEDAIEQKQQQQEEDSVEQESKEQRPRAHRQPGKGKHRATDATVTRPRRRKEEQVARRQAEEQTRLEEQDRRSRTRRRRQHNNRRRQES